MDDGDSTEDNNPVLYGEWIEARRRTYGYR